ncbi:MAG: hypothetical protein ABJO71_06475 [Pseudoruegeria sp.]
MEFESEYEIETWLSKQPPALAKILAARCALKTLPFYFEFFEEELSSRRIRKEPLQLFRASLLITVAASSGTTKDEFHIDEASIRSGRSGTHSTIRHATRIFRDFQDPETQSKVAVSTIQSAISTVAVFLSRNEATELLYSGVSSDAHKVLNRNSINAIFNFPLWAEVIDFPNVANSKEQLLRFANPDTEIWSFWARWYQGMWDGKPLDWELQRRVALIDDAVWKVGPEAVAEEIARIEREMAGPSLLEEKTLLRHVQYLLKNPVLSHATAINGAVTIERAIAGYMREAPANCLPDGLAHLEELPMHFRAIAKVLTISPPVETNERDLLVQIQGLHARVSKLEKELAVAKSKTLKGVISENAAKKFGETIGSLPLWAAVAGNAMFFFGVEPNDLTLENFRGFASELLKQNIETPAPVGQSLPLGTDV